MKELYYVESSAENITVLGVVCPSATIKWFCLAREVNPADGIGVGICDPAEPAQFKPVDHVWNQLFSREEAMLICEHLALPGWINEVKPYYRFPLPQGKGGFTWAVEAKGFYVQLNHSDRRLPTIHGYLDLGTCYLLLKTGNDGFLRFAHVSKEKYFDAIGGE